MRDSASPAWSAWAATSLRSSTFARNSAPGRPHEARVFTAYKGFTGVGGYPTTAAGMKGVPFEVSTNAQIDQDVKQLADMKVDLVKVWVDDHLGKDKKIPLDLVKHIIADAHQIPSEGRGAYLLPGGRAGAGQQRPGCAGAQRSRQAGGRCVHRRHEAQRRRTRFPTLSREASMFVYGSYSKMLDDPLFAQAVSPAMLKTLKTAGVSEEVRVGSGFQGVSAVPEDGAGQFEEAARCRRQDRVRHRHRRAAAHSRLLRALGDATDGGSGDSGARHHRVGEQERGGVSGRVEGSGNAGDQGSGPI